MNAKVDKQWKTKGLESFSNEAIFSTLAHYGVTADDASFRTLAEKHYPLEIAEEWLQTWKGTGQFGTFPLAASELLFRRAFPDALLASTVSKAVSKLMETLTKDSSATADFEAAEALAKQIPPTSDARHESFLEEFVFYLGDKGWEAFNGVAQALGQKKRFDDAMRFAQLEELLLPERREFSTALVRAQKGEGSDVIPNLKAVASNEKEEKGRRLFAVDTLLVLKEWDEAFPLAKTLFDEAEAAKDYHFGMDVAHRIGEIFEQKGVDASHNELIDRMEAFIGEHDSVHTHH